MKRKRAKKPVLNAVPYNSISSLRRHTLLFIRFNALLWLAHFLYEGSKPKRRGEFLGAPQVKVNEVDQLGIRSATESPVPWPRSRPSALDFRSNSGRGRDLDDFF